MKNYQKKILIIWGITIPLAISLIYIGITPLLPIIIAVMITFEIKNFKILGSTIKNKNKNKNKNKRT